MIASLFSGIGGLEFGLEQAGLGETVLQVERDPYCRAVLARHWPEARRMSDVRMVTGRDVPAGALLCGGFPCQDVSAAGLRRGLGTAELPTARSGLWFEFYRIIDETEPALVVIENVASGAGRWLPRVRRDLGALGYASVSLVIGAYQVGARHRRDRIFVVASRDAGIVERVGHLAADADRQGQLPSTGCGGEGGRWTGDISAWAAADPHRFLSDAGEGGARTGCAGRPVADGIAAADPHGARHAQPSSERGDAREAPGATVERDAGASHLEPWSGLAPEPALVRTVHGVPGWLDGDQRAAGWTPARVSAARIRALGNCVVPAQARAIGDLIRAAVAA